VGTSQGSPRPFSLEPLPEAFIDGTEGYIEAIQAQRKDLSRAVILKMIDEEKAKAAGLLTQEASAALLYATLNEVPAQEPPAETEYTEQPEEPEPEGPPGYVPTFESAAGQKIATAMELDISKKLADATDLSPDHFIVVEGSEGVTVTPTKFIGDRWNIANENLEGMGFSYITDNKTKERLWVMNKPKPKVTAKDVVDKAVKAAKPKKETQQAITKPKSIREVEGILIEKFGATILKAVTVTEDAKSLDVEPGSKMPPKQQEAITALLTKYGGTMMDTGMPPGYVWVIPKA
jgi:hypothetical protein